MQLRYKFYSGGDFNPFEKETKESFSQLTKERKKADPENEQDPQELLPRLGAWADYVIANSKNTFWQMERDICKSAADKADEIEDLWNEAKATDTVGEWLMQSEADETVKAMCFFMASLFERFNPLDKTVDFRLYISEGGEAEAIEDEERFNLTPYEG